MSDPVGTMLSIRYEETVSEGASGAAAHAV